MRTRSEKPAHSGPSQPKSKTVDAQIAPPSIQSPNFAGHDFSRISIYADPPLVQRRAAGPSRATTGGGLIVEDAQPVGSGGMHKTEFLAALREALCEVAQAEAGFVCPGIDQLFATYGPRSAERCETAIRRYLGSGPAVANAMDYIPLIAERARGAIRVWKTTGKVTGIPPEVADTLPVPLPGPRVARKGRNRDSAAAADSPAAIQSELGAGRPLDGASQARFGSAMRMDFSRVRIHDDADAARLCGRLDARAFTVGPHVAFAPGEFRPETPIGDALLAHELAHVAQQSAGGAGEAAYGALEEDADRSAVGAVASLWGRVKTIGTGALPALKSGLRLQRCGGKTSEGAIGPARQAQAMANFRDKNDGRFTPAELDKIDSALRKASDNNEELIISFYDYFSTHKAGKDPALRGKKLDAKLDPGGMLGSPSMDVNPDALDPSWSDARLGASLIHEFSHTRHDKGMGVGDAQEGDSYGIEYFFAERKKETDRMDIIFSVVTKQAGGIWLSKQEYRDGILRFQISYGTLTALQEVIDGKPPRGGPTGPFGKLTPADARRLMARLVDTGQAGDAEVATLADWVEKNLKEFKFPVYVSEY